MVRYDAAPILGLGKGSDELLPEPAANEIVIRVGRWSLKDLRTCETIVRDHSMWNEKWYDKYAWSDAKLIPGAYRVRMRIPDSDRKIFADQKKLLLPGEEVASVALAATVLFCHLNWTGKDLLNGDRVRCAEALQGEYRVGLDVLKGRVNVHYSLWDENGHDGLWIAGCRKC